MESRQATASSSNQAESPLDEPLTSEWAAVARLIAESRALGAALQRAAEVALADPAQAALLLHGLKEQHRVHVAPCIDAITGASSPLRLSPAVVEAPAHPQLLVNTQLPSEMAPGAASTGLPIFVRGVARSVRVAAADPPLAFVNISVDSVPGNDDNRYWAGDGI